MNDLNNIDTNKPMLINVLLQSLENSKRYKTNCYGYYWSFGASHDGAANGCEAASGDAQHVMSPQLSSDAGPIIWSNCSRRDITKFLDHNWGMCLEDRPSDHEFQYPRLPPGAMYNVDHQCRLQYGPDAQHCAGMDEVNS